MSDTCIITQQDVTYPSGNITLGGTLFLPEVVQSYPAIVFVHGAGDETRDAWRRRAESIARQGIATLIYDKRGTGISTGNWRDGSYRVLAEDALAGIRFLKEHCPTLNVQKIGLCGCSEGGWVVPLAATLSPDVAFLIAISAAGMTPVRQEYYRRENLIREQHSNRAAIGLRMLGVKSMFNILRLFPQSTRGFLGFSRRTIFFDPLPTWRSIRQPVLALWGEEDKAIPPHQSATIIEQVLQQTNHHNYTIHIFPGADHGIGITTETADGEEKWEPAPGFIEMIAEWVKKQTS